MSDLVRTSITHDQGAGCWHAEVGFCDDSEMEHGGSGPDPLAACLDALGRLYAAWHAARRPDEAPARVLTDFGGIRDLAEWVAFDHDGKALT